VQLLPATDRRLAARAHLQRRRAHPAHAVAARLEQGGGLALEADAALELTEQLGDPALGHPLPLARPLLGLDGLLLDDDAVAGAVAVEPPALARVPLVGGDAGPEPRILSGEGVGLARVVEGELLVLAPELVDQELLALVRPGRSR
jgi:hypothetical protein